MEGIVFGPIVKIVITQAMFKAWDDRLKIFYVIVLILSKSRMLVVAHLLRINEEVRDLLAQLCGNLDHYYCVGLGFE